MDTIGFERIEELLARLIDQAQIPPKREGAIQAETSWEGLRTCASRAWACGV